MTVPSRPETNAAGPQDGGPLDVEDRRKRDSGLPNPRTENGSRPDGSGLAVETMGLTKRYGSLVAVDDLDLEVPAGSIFALIGPNGAGKTTTFRILATLLRPTSGVATVSDLSVDSDAAEVRRLLGYMPDFFGLYDDVKVSEYLEFFAASYRIPVQKRAGVTRDLLELVDLSHKADSFVESLSRGMKQRLGLARALVHDPEVLILDEPASGLDPRARVELLQLLRELKDMGKTVIVSSHILPELEEVCTDVGILEAGRLLVQGSPAEIMAERTGIRAFRMRLAAAADQGSAEAVLSASKLVREVVWDGAEGRLSFAGNDEQAAQLLSGLVSAGCSIVEFAEDPAGLEELFLDVTKGKVQ